MMKVWLFSALDGVDDRWDGTVFMSAGDTAEDAARSLLRDRVFLDWWWLVDPPTRIWARSMRPSSGVSRIDADRKYAAMAFEEMWSDDEVEVAVSDL